MQECCSHRWDSWSTRPPSSPLEHRLRRRPIRTCCRRRARCHFVLPLCCSRTWRHVSSPVQCPRRPQCVQRAPYFFSVIFACHSSQVMGALGLEQNPLLLRLAQVLPGLVACDIRVEHIVVLRAAFASLFGSAPSDSYSSSATLSAALAQYFFLGYFGFSSRKRSPRWQSWWVDLQALLKFDLGQNLGDCGQGVTTAMQGRRSRWKSWVGDRKHFADGSDYANHLALAGDSYLS